MIKFGGTFEEEILNVQNKFNEAKKEDDVMLNFDELKDFTPEEINDESVFKPLKGAYECVIEKLEHIQGVSEKSGDAYDFYSLSMQIATVVEGDKGVGRYFKRTYNNDNEGIKKLLNDMFTAKIELDRSSQEALDASLSNAKDKIVKVRSWVWTPEKDRNGNPIAENDRKGIQQLKIVKEFKLGKDGKDKSENPKASEVPF